MKITRRSLMLGVSVVAVAAVLPSTGAEEAGYFVQRATSFVQGSRPPAWAKKFKTFTEAHDASKAGDIISNLNGNWVCHILRDA